MFGQNLKKIMAEKGTTSKFLAGKVGISPTHLSYIINERRNVSVELANKIADALNVPTSVLFENNKGQVKPAVLIAENGKPADLKKFIEQAEVMFDGELYNLDEEDKQKVRDALEFAFWHAKQKNKRKKT